MIWLAFQKLTAADRAHEFAVTDLNFASDRNHGRTAFDFPAFKCAVVDIHLLRFRGDQAGVFRIIDHQVSVAADLDRPLRGYSPNSLAACVLPASTSVFKSIFRGPRRACKAG